MISITLILSEIAIFFGSGVKTELKLYKMSSLFTNYLFSQTKLCCWLLCTILQYKFVYYCADKNVHNPMLLVCPV